MKTHSLIKSFINKLFNLSEMVSNQLILGNFLVLLRMYSALAFAITSIFALIIITRIKATVEHASEIAIVFVVGDTYEFIVLSAIS